VKVIQQQCQMYSDN